VGSALLARFPELAASVPWISLGQFPTPVARLARLGQQLGAELWVKRDDLSGEVYGGNKVRKLEHLLAEARRRSTQAVVTVGGIGSNHLVATAIYGRQLGLPTRAVVVPQPVTPHVRRVLDQLRVLGVELVPCSSRLAVPLALLRARRGLERPFVIPPGGSSPLGTLGYVAAGLELAAQIHRGEMPPPDDIFVTLGSGGTIVGLRLGLALARLSCRVVGVRVVERVLAHRAWLQILSMRTAALLRRIGVPSVGALPLMTIIHDQYGGQYGRATVAGQAAADLTMETEGLKLDTTYTAKTMAALVACCQSAGRSRRLLFWHTFNSRDVVLPASSLPLLPQTIRMWLADPAEISSPRP
jgi:1-aminocyclopropane-1-carboxylate deaminase/D-cysteine desulfhydrase-like pyridoxal-dependent ACC family enzyme